MRLSPFVFLALLPAVLVLASESPILQRQELMENMKDHALKPMVGMVRGEEDFDATTVADGFGIMREVADQAGSLFPEGSDTGHDTEALPAIWTDRAGFDQRLADFGAAVDAAAAANPQSVAELQPVLKGIIDTCKGCHDNYRVEQE